MTGCQEVLAGRDDRRHGCPWPASLARPVVAAGQMTVPAPLRPPVAGGRPAAVLILFGSGPPDRICC